MRLSGKAYDALLRSSVPRLKLAGGESRGVLRKSDLVFWDEEPGYSQEASGLERPHVPGLVPGTVLKPAGGEGMGYFAVNEASSERARNPLPIVPRHEHDTRFHRSGVEMKLQPLGSLTAVDVGNRFHRWCRSKFFTLSVDVGRSRRHLECRSCN